MTASKDSSENRRRLPGWGAVVGTLLSALVLSGCSSTPEWADPTALWDNAFGDEEDARPTDAPKVDDKQGFPKLSSTPEKPTSASTAEERRAVADSLVADRDNARYTDETLRGQVASIAPPQRPAAAAPAAAQPAAAPPVVAAPAPLPPPDERVATDATSVARPADGLQGRSVAPVANYDRINVPSIVQRRGQPLPPPTPIEEVSRGRSALTPIRARETPAPPKPMVGEAMVKESMESAGRMADTAADAARQAAEDKMMQVMDDKMEQAAAKPMMADAGAVAAAAPAMIDSGLSSPAAMAAAANVNLPVGQDQSILEQVFASQVAAQNAGVFGQRAVLPSTAVAAYAAGAGLPTRPAPLAQAAGSGNYTAADGESLRLPGAPVVVRFGSSSSQLGPKGQRQVEAAARLARERGGMVRVVGHASQRTTDMPYAKHKIVNFNVSLDRANAVASLLARRGVPRENIIVEARGDEEPVFHEFMPNGEAYNRRVEIYLQ